MLGGRLFSRYFLEDGITTQDAWAGLSDAETDRLAQRTRDLLDRFARFQRPSEAETEDELIFPILGLLGWPYLRQQSAGAGQRTDVPDALLFLDDGAKERAVPLQQWERLETAAVIVESKARGVPFDRRSGNEGTPSSQLLRYLNIALGRPGPAARWGILTDGLRWRLYWTGARARHEGYVELDLPGLLAPMLLEQPGGHGLGWFRVFVLLFRRDAFVPTGPSARSFLDDALDEGRRYEAHITDKLSGTVFDDVFPALATALHEGDPLADPADAGWRREAKEAALVLLFRLLFILYAEDRDLFPLDHPGYGEFALLRLRKDAAAVVEARQPASARATTWWSRLRALFTAIKDGDPALGLPPYNGGLFDDDARPLLTRVTIPDATLAALVDDLSREGTGLARRYINYRDLSVQKLGSIYERLLEFDVVQHGAGVTIQLNRYARRNSGSYYTADELVMLILRRTVGPLLDERRAAFEAKAAELASDTRRKAERLLDLKRLDPASTFLDLKVCDPAMGSGHFLVSLVDYLADHVLAAMAEAAAGVPWADRMDPYRSPLAARRPDREDPRAYRAAGEGARLDRPAAACRRQGDRAADHSQARGLRRRSQPHGRRAGQAVALARELHRRRASVVPRPPSALR